MSVSSNVLNLPSVLLTAFLGVATFILGQAILRLYVDTYIEYRKAQGLVRAVLYSRYEFVNGGHGHGLYRYGNKEEVTEEFYNAGINLERSYYPLPRLLSLLHFVPNKGNVDKAVLNLLILSQVIGIAGQSGSVTQELADEIKSRLGI